MIISRYSGGVTLRDIRHRLASTIGTGLSHETLSKITDEIGEEIVAWQSRPLDAPYPVVCLDAMVVKVRHGVVVKYTAAHVAIGVDMDGVKHVLGIWVQATEGVEFWGGGPQRDASGDVTDAKGSVYGAGLALRRSAWDDLFPRLPKPVDGSEGSVARQQRGSRNSATPFGCAVTDPFRGRAAVHTRELRASSNGVVRPDDCRDGAPQAPSGLVTGPRRPRATCGRGFLHRARSVGVVTFSAT